MGLGDTVTQKQAVKSVSLATQISKSDPCEDLSEHELKVINQAKEE